MDWSQVKSFFKKKLLKEEIQDNLQSVLTPSLVKNGHRAYSTVQDLKIRIRKGDAKNIAITGPYGSGKSSIIRTLIQEFNDESNDRLISKCRDKPEFLTISLATLKAPDKDNQEQINNTEKIKVVDNKKLNRQIEYSILQQLIYRENSHTVPNSRFKRIFHIGKSKLFVLSIVGVLFLSSLLLLCSESFSNLIFQLISALWSIEFVTKKFLFLKSGSIFIISIVLYKLISYAIRSFGNSKLNLLNLKNGEIKLSEASIFNEHLDEILYFFQVTRYNVIIIEDLDRFETSEIFLKLRELNLLLNESNIIKRKNNRPIIFIYAIRDDMFFDSERSKFFDYITTVIPVISLSNSKEILKNELKVKGYDDIDDFDLKEIAFFIDDMRLLKNITNEYHQYIQKLNNDKLCPEKLLAMIVFKNYHPKDFSDLHKSKGKIYRFFRLKSKFIEIAKEDNSKKLNEEEKKKQHILDNQHLREEELRLIYLNKYREHIGKDIKTFYIEDKEYTITQIRESEELFKQLTSINEVKYRYFYQNYSNTFYTDVSSINRSFSSIEEAVDPNQNYIERVTAIRNNHQEQIRLLTTLKEDIDKLYFLRISELIQKIDLKKCPEFQGLELDDMTLFFLSRGYIDENYFDYISYFYDSMISNNDREFILSTKLNNPTSYDYPLDKVENCISEIPDYAYNNKAILNLNLLEYLDGKIPTKMKKIVDTALENRAWDFLSLYYPIYRQLNKSGKNNTAFEYVFSNNKVDWNDLFSYSEDNQKYKETLISIWLVFAENSKSTENSKAWIISNYNFITSLLNKTLTLKELEQIISTHHYKFSQLNNSSETLDLVLKYNAYEVNKGNIELITAYLLSKEKVEPVNLSLIYQTNNENFISIISNNIEYCLTKIFSEPASKQEGEATILKLLLNKDIQDDVKIRYLSNQINTINIIDCEDNNEAIHLAMKAMIITPTWENISKYKAMEDSEDILIKYISRYFKELLEDMDESKELRRKLAYSFMGTNMLDFETYKQLIPAFKIFRFSSVDFTILSINKVQLLVEYNMLSYSTEQTTSLIEHLDDETIISFILQNKSDFFKDLSEYTLSPALFTSLWRNKLSKEERLELLRYLEQIHLNDNLDLGNSIIKFYIEEKLPISYDRCLMLLQASNDVIKQIELFGFIEDETSEEEITNLLSCLPEPYSDITKHGKRPKVPLLTETQTFTEYLKGIDYISSYKIEGDKIRINTKQGS